jgi:hypothetical protein
MKQLFAYLLLLKGNVLLQSATSLAASCDAIEIKPPAWSPKTFVLSSVEAEPLKWDIGHPAPSGN